MRNIREANKYQTQLTEDLIKSFPDEVFSDLLEYIDSVEFIKNLVSPNIPTIDTAEKDENGLVIVDVTKPHMLENVDYFRQAAIHFKTYGKYTLLTPNPHPNSPYKLFWREEKRRCLEGYIRPDGEWITGDLYFYWNYCPILQTKRIGNSKRGERVRDFPKPWLGDYLFFHYKHSV